MGNSYSSSPAIIPGNLTVTGNLSVLGAQFQLGANPRKYRIQENSNGVFTETVNLDAIGVAQDDTSASSIKRLASGTGSQHQLIFQAANQPGTDRSLLLVNNGNCQLNQDEIRVGAGAPYVRVLKPSAVKAGVSVNLGKDLLTQDDAAKLSWWQGQDTSSGLLTGGFLDPAVGVSFFTPGNTRSPCGADVVATGTVTETAIVTLPAMKGWAGFFGSIFIRLFFDVTTVAGGGVTARVYYGSGGNTVMTIPASVTAKGRLDVLIMEKGANNQQVLCASAFYPGAAEQITTLALAVDNTVGQQIKFTCQNANISDSITIHGPIIQSI